MRTIFTTACVVIVLLAFAATAAHAATPDDKLLVVPNNQKAKGCHNFTGTCLDHGFVCANEEVVPHSQRCNGVEDCADGTDEFMCHHEDDTPLSVRAPEERHAVQQASCIRCTCVASVHRVVSGQPWFQYAIHAPTDFLGLMTGTGTYRGLNCSPKCAFTILMAFYRKTGVCRGWLCCARQRECINCNFVLAGCTTVSAANRCYA